MKTFSPCTSQEQAQLNLQREDNVLREQLNGIPEDLGVPEPTRSKISIGDEKPEAAATATAPDRKSAKLTIFTAMSPGLKKKKRLSKGFSLGENGKLKKHPGGQLSQGRLQQHSVSSLSEFAELLANLKPHQALSYGVPKDAKAAIVRRRKAVAGRQGKSISRTKENFRWPQSPGIMMLDYDPPEDAAPLRREELIEEIRMTAFDMMNVGVVWTPSASSCIWHGDKQLRGVCGQRLYILVQDASDIPRAGQVLADILWLNGHGSVRVSKSGQRLLRTLVDTSVWRAEGLDFAGGAALAGELQQRRGDPVVYDGDRLDTRKALPNLSKEEIRQVNDLKAEAKAEVSDEANAMHERWVSERLNEIVPERNRENKEATESAKSVARDAVELGVLRSSYILRVEIDGKVRKVSVAEVLAKAEEYDGCLTCDPIEPDYDGGRLVGKLYLEQSRPALHSFARGERTYTLWHQKQKYLVKEGGTAEATDSVIKLLKNDFSVFDFGTELVVVEDGRNWPLCEATLSKHLANSVQFFRCGEKSNVPIDPPKDVLKQIIALGQRRKLKPLEAIVTGPTVRLEGTVVDQPGYDPQSRLYFDLPMEGAPEVLDTPTLEEAKAALEVLWKPFDSFPFVDEAARGALLAALLTAVVRPFLPTSPAFGFDAPIQASGKTLLASCVGALAEGCKPTLWPHTRGRDDEETRKRLFAALRTGRPSLIWDNVLGVFDSASMASLLTSSSMTDRILGRSESATLPNRSLIMLTGNNLVLAGDLPRRVIKCRIDPESATPFDREFALDPLKFVVENRLELMAAACTLIRARFTYLESLAPGKTASFEEWDHIVRQTVVWAGQALGGFADPMELIRVAHEDDPDQMAWGSVLSTLHGIFGEGEFSAKEVHYGAFDDALHEALLDLIGRETSVRSVGKLLSYRTGRIVDGLRLQSRTDRGKNVKKYRIEIVE